MNMTIKSRLITVITFLSVLAAGIGMLGLHGMNKSNEGLKAVYEDRALVLEELSKIDQISQAIGQIEGVTQRNAVLVEEAGNASESLRDQAVRLSQLVTVFKLDEVAAAQALSALPQAASEARVSPALRIASE